MFPTRYGKRDGSPDMMDWPDCLPTPCNIVTISWDITLWFAWLITIKPSLLGMGAAMLWHITYNRIKTAMLGSESLTSRCWVTCTWVYSTSRSFRNPVVWHVSTIGFLACWPSVLIVSWNPLSSSNAMSAWTYNRDVSDKLIVWVKTCCKCKRRSLPIIALGRFTSSSIHLSP